MPEYIDLHTHTNASDGTLSPAELVQLAKKSGLAAVAVTDHDTMDGVEEAAQTAFNLNIRFIPGVEMGAVYKEKEIHLLGYLLKTPAASISNSVNPIKDIINLPTARIYNDLYEFAHNRDLRNDEILKRLAADNIILDKKELYFDNPKTQITRAHFARLMIKKGYVKDIKQAFSSYLVYNGKYIPPKTTDVAKVMNFFNKYNFFTSLAHPIQYNFSNKELEQLILYLKNLGLSGIEVHHSSHNLADIMKLKKYALKYRLYPTGGSDFHGENKPDIMIGKGYGGLKIPISVLYDMEKSYTI